MRRAAGYNSEDNRQYAPPLPNLPGVTTQAPMEPRPRGHTLRYVNGYRIAEDVQPIDPLNRTHKWDGRVQDLGPSPPFALHEAGPGPSTQRGGAPQDLGSSTAAAASSARAPNWITYDRKVLGFGAYFREDVPYSPLESWRVRKVAIRYYLETDQIEVVEGREPNSGLAQGVLLKRHSAAKEDGTPLRWSDLRVGAQLVLYRRTYHLVAANTATRAFYSEQGQEQPPDESYPEGPYDQRRKALEASARGSRPQPPTHGSVPSQGPPIPSDPKSHSLPISPRGPHAVFDLLPVKPSADEAARDGAVLRFLAAWDNTAVIFGEVLSFALSYHVADGTVEVREVARRNSGRDPFPLLLSRSRLPKTLPPVHGRPMSPATRQQLAIPYYDWRDLYLGATVNVYGRQMLLYDCDDTTRAWLQKNVPGLCQEQLVPIQVDFDPFGPKRPPPVIPPNSSGIGSDEDSLQSCLRLVPRRPAASRSYTDYLAKWNKVLRFAAVLVPLGPGRPLVGPHDAERRFILSFHPVDGTMAVWEPKQPNSGMEQGVFLERAKVPNPATGQPYGETDMQVGAVLEVFGRGFQLLDADAFTLLYMEQQVYRFPWADFDKALSKLTTWLTLYPDHLPDRLRGDLAAASDVRGSGYITKYQLYDLLTALGCDVTPHEVITLVRQLGADRQGLLAGQLLAALRLASPPPTPPPAQDRRQSDLESRQPTPPAHPPVPFPAPGMRAGAWPPFRRVAWGPDPATAQAKASAAATGGGFGSATAAAAYQGLGPTPGHPRVDMHSKPQHHQAGVGAYPGAAAYVSAGGVGGKLGHRASLSSSAAAAWAWGQSSSDNPNDDYDDRQSARDTPGKSRRDSQAAAGGPEDPAGPFGSSWTDAAATAGGGGGSQRAAAAGGRPAGGSSFLTTGVKQPTSLWQTTNMAFGGVGHSASFQRR